MHSEQTPSRYVYGYPCSIFSGLRTVFLADSVQLRRGTTFIRCIRTPTRPHLPFTRIHTRIPTKYRACSPEAIKTCFGFFCNSLYN